MRGYTTTLVVAIVVALTVATLVGLLVTDLFGVTSDTIGGL